MSKNYEGLFIFAGNAKDEALDKIIERTTAEIEKHGGVIESTEVHGRRTFARPMDKRDNGVYVKIRFAMDPAQLVPLRARFKLGDDVFRVQIVLRNERVEAAKAKDADRRSAYKASVERAEAAAAAAAADGDDTTVEDDDVVAVSEDDDTAED